MNLLKKNFTEPDNRSNRLEISRDVVVVHLSDRKSSRSTRMGKLMVEKILDRKIINGEVYYLLKWKDFDNTDNTWVDDETAFGVVFG